MAIFNQPATAKKESVPFPSDPMPAPAKESTPINDYAAPQPAAARWTEPRTEAKESLIASDITIEGKIEGAGHIRLAGRFKGDVHIQGDLTIDVGAKLTGSVRANTVIISGEVEGNIESARADRWCTVRYPDASTSQVSRPSSPEMHRRPRKNSFSRFSSTGSTTDRR